MKIVDNLKIVAGIIILLSSMTILIMAFIENELYGLAVLFNFNVGIATENIFEAIVASILLGVAGLVFWFAMLIIGVIYLAIMVNLGVLTLVLKRNKPITIIILLFTTFSLALETRAVIILALADLFSVVFTLRIIGDCTIIAICIFSLVKLFQTPREIKKIDQ